jgi:hypothetical protein
MISYSNNLRKGLTTMSNIYRKPVVITQDLLNKAFSLGQPGEQATQKPVFKPKRTSQPTTLPVDFFQKSVRGLPTPRN